VADVAGVAVLSEAWLAVASPAVAGLALAGLALPPPMVLLPLRYGAGFVARPPWRTSKWTCGPVQEPVQPTSPIFCPARTYSFTATLRSDRCA
jgi:hypothetical protein